MGDPDPNPTNVWLTAGGTQPAEKILARTGKRGADGAGAPVGDHEIVVQMGGSAGPSGHHTV